MDLPASIYSLYSNIRVLNLPGRSDFGTVDPILTASYHVEYFFGEALYLKSPVSSHQCNSIVQDGRYFGILGNLAGGGQVYFAANIEFHENSLDQPIADGGGVLTKGPNAKCPVPAKSFMNGKFS